MRFTRSLTALIALSVVCLSAHAQFERPDRGNRPDRGDGPPRGERSRSMQRLAPEQAEAAWKLQADGVSHGLGLSETNTAKLIETYKKARMSHREAMRELRGDRPGRDRPQGNRGEGQGRPNRGAGADDQRKGDKPRDEARKEAQEKRNEVTVAEKTRLRTELATFLAGEQLDYAAYVLGTFSSQWDSMAHAVARFKLDDAKQTEALGHIETYVAETAKLRAANDREAASESTKEARSKLAEALKGVLSEEQLARFRRATSDRKRSAGQSNDRFARLDANGDGLIQRSEAPEQMMRMFDQLDANGDDALDAEELKALSRGRNKGGGRGPGGKRN